MLNKNNGEKYLQYISDIHLEKKKNKPSDILGNFIKIQPYSKGHSYLALLGDIGNPYMTNYNNFLEYHAKIFEHIFVISGNHEYYTSKKKQYTIENIEEEIKKICDQYENITYLQKSKIQIGQTLFIGCTLWSNISKVQNIAYDSINDYSNIYVKNDHQEEERILIKDSYIHGQKKYRI